MRILIFGGTGAIGDPLALQLARAGHEVFVTTRHPHTFQEEHLHYLVGNIHEMDFVRQTLWKHYDVLINFMNYSQDEFSQCAEELLSAVGQYFFLSSCRVYAPSEEPITEQSPRLLDVCTDKEYLATEEYGLAKAREENLLLASKNKNWTIVRPTVIYNSHRLQLGCYEMEHWLYRSLQGRPILFFEDLMNVRTPMTYGGDVAQAIAILAGNPAVMGEVVQIATPQTMTWAEILQVYSDTIKSCWGGYLEVHLQPHAQSMETALGRKWRLKYNRLCDRKFVSDKLDAVCGDKVEYAPMAEGLRRCLTEFLQGERQFGTIDLKNEAWMDRATHTYTPLFTFDTTTRKVKYLVARYTPYFALQHIRYV